MFRATYAMLMRHYGIAYAMPLRAIDVDTLPQAAAGFHAAAITMLELPLLRALQRIESRLLLDTRCAICCCRCLPRRR